MVVICDQQLLASLQGAAAIVTAPRSCVTAIGNIAADPSSQRARRVLYAAVSSSSIGESSLLLGMENALSLAIVGGALNLLGGATTGEGNHWPVGTAGCRAGTASRCCLANGVSLCGAERRTRSRPLAAQGGGIANCWASEAAATRVPCSVSSMVPGDGWGAPEMLAGGRCGLAFQVRAGSATSIQGPAATAGRATATSSSSPAGTVLLCQPGVRQ